MSGIRSRHSSQYWSVWSLSVYLLFLMQLFGLLCHSCRPSGAGGPLVVAAPRSASFDKSRPRPILVVLQILNTRTQPLRHFELSVENLFPIRKLGSCSWSRELGTSGPWRCSWQSSCDSSGSRPCCQTSSRSQRRLRYGRLCT